MKYEAKDVGGVATSQAASTPWVSISQTDAITTAAAACTGCHLITEAEWMTIAQNVLGVASNWSTGTVGSGFIYSGHNDNSPGNALDADSNDTNGYYGTGNTSPSNQKRTLTLSNGEVIWDLAGNVWEWTSGTVQSPTIQPGITGAGYDGRQWTAITNPGTLSINPSPAGTGIAGASAWNTGNGIGLIYSDTEQVGLRGFLRGGYWTGGSGAGVLTLSLYLAPSYAAADVGFRVAVSP
jgi:formylglycine-generating enzyme required for sulfatase activity